MIKKMICIRCPMGCLMTVDCSDLSDVKVSGNTCPRGAEYAKAEVTHPERTVTGTVKLCNGGMLPVKTKSPIPKELIFSCLQEMSKVVAQSPVKIGDVIIANVCCCGVDVVATKDMK